MWTFFHPLAFYKHFLVFHARNFNIAFKKNIVNPYVLVQDSYKIYYLMELSSVFVFTFVLKIIYIIPNKVVSKK